MKKAKYMLILLMVIFAAMGLFVGCGNNSVKTPSEIIGDAYGNKEFTLMFSVEDADEPISEITYTANSMPVLPTPKRLGYIFGGWYLDSAFTTRYTDGILFLYMKDMTLYAKWEKEDFSQDGVYDIELKCEVLKDTLKNGELTESTGGYKDFAQSIVESQSWIEVVGGEKLLKIQYDCGTTVPFTYDSVFEVSLSSESSAYSYIKERIATDSETVKTIFINIDKLFEDKGYNISQPVYLDIAATNWTTPGISNTDRSKTTALYRVSVKISRFIGFSKSFIDPSVPLEDGFYSVKAHYLQKNAKSTMMESYNPVYGYIIVKDGKYQLVKQFTPYAGLIGIQTDLLDPFILNYYNRAMTFSLAETYFNIDYDFSSGKEVQSDYYPQTYGGDTYGEFTMEFHADTGKYYAIYDLDQDLTKQIMFMGAATGYMEVAGAMGQMSMIMTLDYKHIIKLAYIDYEPLAKDAYMIGDKLVYYPGSIEDLADNTAYNALTEYGISTDMANFYYSASSINESVYSRNMYSHRITVTPTAGTNSQKVSESRYKLAVFNTKTEIFGYNGTDNLYADYMSVNNFGGYGLRNKRQIVVGKTFRVNDTVDIADIYSQKVDAVFDASKVMCEIYSPSANGGFDFSSATIIKKGMASEIQDFTFSSKIAVVFTSSRTVVRADSTQSYYTAKTVIELVEYSEPQFILYSSGEKDAFEPGKTYVVGDKIPYPLVKYEWMGTSGFFADNYYDSEEGKIGLNLLHVLKVYTEPDGTKSTAWVSKEEMVFEVNSTGLSVMYEAVNRYGEKNVFAVEIKATEAGEVRPGYQISKDGQIIYNNVVSYDKDGKIVPIKETGSYFLSSSDLLSAGEYLISIGNTAAENMPLISYSVKTQQTVKSINTEGAEARQVIDEIKSAVGNNYAYITLVYSNATHTVTERYLVNVTFGGSDSAQILGGASYFTGHKYTFYSKAIYSLDGKKIGVLAQKVYIHSDMGSKSNTLVSNLGQFSLILNYIGNYTLSYTASMRYMENGEYVFADGAALSFSYKQNIYAQDGKGDITVVYHTDSRHPFAGGLLTKTVTYNLTQDIVTLRKTSFEDYSLIKQLLYGWAKRSNYVFTDECYDSGAKIDSFIDDFNSDEVHLYAIWDEGILITPDLDFEVTGKTGMPVRYYLQDSGVYKGYYIVSLADFVVPAVSGWTFMGWDVDGEILSATATVRIKKAFLLKAVYKQKLNVRYDIDQTKSKSWFGDDVVLDGELLKENRVPVCREGWEFTGWVKVLYDENGTETGTVSFDTDSPITENIVLRATFKAV